MVDSSDPCPAIAGSKLNGCNPEDIIVTVSPTVTGTAKVGSTLNATDPVYTVPETDPTVSLGPITREWFRCTTVSFPSCTLIPGAVGNSYTLVAADTGTYILYHWDVSNADDYYFYYAAPIGPIQALTLVEPPATQQPITPVATCTVPKLKKKKLAAAKKSIKKAGCAVGKVKKKKKIGYKKGRVIKQSVAAKKVVPAGTKINLTVAK